jgi:hypothetical protein
VYKAWISQVQLCVQENDPENCDDSAVLKMLKGLHTVVQVNPNACLEQGLSDYLQCAMQGMDFFADIVSDLDAVTLEQYEVVKRLFQENLRGFMGMLGEEKWQEVMSTMPDPNRARHFFDMLLNEQQLGAL